MDAGAHRISASSAALAGSVALASAMGVGRFAFTPLLAAACSTAATSRAWRELSPRKLWAGGQLVMAVGLLAPAVRLSLPTLIVSAVCVGGPSWS